MKPWNAEIIAIGDELISGQRLDTNTQWLSRELSDLGLEPRFHTTVGDSLEDGIAAFQAATRRSEFVISTGGIGPTQDDLTRRVMADMAGVQLKFHPEVVEHIKAIYRDYGREMPESNTLQAWFPDGASMIGNGEGTAPGIDQQLQIDGRPVRLFALPGVPYEMKEMWGNHVRPAILKSIGQAQAIVHHVIHCFGAGESQIESMLDGLTQRGREPRVGITASQATISLRIVATGAGEDQCRLSISKATNEIRQRLGTLVFGENGDQLQDTVSNLLTSRGQTIAFVDYGFGGVASSWLASANMGKQVHSGCIVLSPDKVPEWLGTPASLNEHASTVEAAAAKIRTELKSDIGVAIGPPRVSETQTLPTYPIAVATSDSCRSWLLTHGGHSGLREQRTAKQILNHIRLFLVGFDEFT